MPYPTADPQVNEMIATLQAHIQQTLGRRLIGLYLDGSLTSGAFDAASDIDFVAVLEDAVDEATFLDLQRMHDEIQTLETPWAIQIEGSYVSKAGLRRFDPAQMRFPNIERDRGERLKWVDHDAGWNIHRWVLRERGIRLLGPNPAELIDPVSAEDLREAVRSMRSGWTDHFIEDPAPLQSRGYQSYTVLSLCRMQYTLETDGVASKPEAAAWGKQRYPLRAGLIERAWENRSQSAGPADAQDVAETLDFIRETRHWGE